MINILRKKSNKKAIYYTIDAMFAGFLLLGALLFMLANKHIDERSEQKLFLSQDVLNSLADIKIYEINNSFISTEIANGNITNINNSILDQVSQYWATGNNAKATVLLEYMINGSLPAVNGLKISLGSDLLMEKNISTFSNLVSSSRMISGVELGKPLSGSSGSAYLKKISNKRSSTYIYFGGFVGQGNITTVLDLGVITVTNITLEMDVALGASFNIRINGALCNSTAGNPTYNSVTPDMIADTWDLTNCQNLLEVGFNNITFNFANVSTAYIQGGYFKVTYMTDEFQEDLHADSNKYYIPGIKGIVNLYDSFFVPGDLNNLTIYLHYNVNTSGNSNKFYMTIGNTTIFYDNTTQGDKNQTFFDKNLSMLDYTSLSKLTVPIRIGFENLTFQTVILNATGFGDVILTTDVSGSMDDNFTGGGHRTVRNCADPLIYSATTQKLSVAKCLDNQFVANVLANNSQNLAGLVSYSTTTSSIINLTNNVTVLTNEVGTYTPLSATCISCGIVDSLATLLDKVNDDSWKYWEGSQYASAPVGWTTLGFDDSAWPTNNTPIGFNVSGIITSLNTTPVYANLWEYFNDTSGPPDDFSSGRLNSTANTYGLNLSGNQGWDSQKGVYGGNATNVTIRNVSMYYGNYRLKIDINATSTRQISDGSYGIQINITPAMYTIISNGGEAYVSFDYRWDSPSGAGFSSTDQVWIKSRWTKPGGFISYLGSSQDNGDSGSDNTNEVWSDDDPSNDVSATFTQNIAALINQSGMYYLDFGGKLSRNSGTEKGNFSFDNIQLLFVRNIGKTYYRNTFQIDNTSNISSPVVYISSDDNALVYINGNLIDNDTGVHTHATWNRFANIPNNLLVSGTNIVAVQLNNNDSTSGYFDLDIRANIGNKQKDLVIMSDGDANTCVTSWSGSSSSGNCNECGGRACCPNPITGQMNQTCPNLANIGNSGDGVEEAFEQVINISCYLHKKYNIGLFSVAFGMGVSQYGSATLNMSASCDNITHFYNANNVTGLTNIYSSIANSILSGFLATQSQEIVFSGGSFGSSILYPDSYIAYNYTPISQPAVPGEIEITFQSPKFTSCNPQINIPEGLRVIDAKVASYSGIHWTNYLSANGIEVYNLTDYNPTYIRLGDPFLVQIPSNYIVTGQNNFTMATGDDANTFTNCSNNNSFIYTALVNSTISRTDVLPEKTGCKWIVESETYINNSLSIPTTYAGNSTCYYTNASISYDPNDAYEYAAYKIFKQLDANQDGRIIVSLTQDDLEVLVLTVSGLPYMWGPSIMRAEVWQ